MLKKRWLFLFLALSLFVLVSACGGVNEQLPTSTPPLTSTLTFALASNETPTPTIPEAFVITTTSLSIGDIGVSYLQTLTTSGGAFPYRWSISSGSLPAGLSFNSLTGVISGTPTTAGTYSFTAVATDNMGSKATKALSITINRAPTITQTSLPSGNVGISYTQALSVPFSTPPHRWSISSGSLPAGLLLDPSTGTISGTPTAAGTYSFTAMATDNLGNKATNALSITINRAPAIAQASSPSGSVGAFYSQTMSASGGASPYRWSISAGSLPAGLSLDPSTGTISGTPTTAGACSFRILVNDSVGGTATKTLSITINPASAKSTPSLPPGDVGIFYLQSVATSGSALPYRWSISAGSLPAGLSLDSLTSVISGTPMTAGTYSFTVQVSTIGGGTLTQSLSITINLTPAITTTWLPTGKIGVSYSQALAAYDGTPPYRWSISSGSLPDGLSLDSSTGLISGTPTKAGKYNFTALVTDKAGGTATETLSVTITT